MADDYQSPINISSESELRGFLEGRPREDAVAIARRAAWRIMPFIARDQSDASFKRLTLACFRATLNPMRGRRAAANAANAAYAAVAHTAAHTATAAADAAGYAAHTAYAADAAGAAAAAAVYAVAAARYAAANVADIWREIEADCQALHTGEVDLLTRPLWMETPEWFSKAYMAWRLRLTGNYTVVSKWIQSILGNATVDPFPNRVLDEIANETEYFWGDMNEARSSRMTDPDVVMEIIAERLGWKPEPQKIEDSPYDPAFIGYDPIQLNREGPQPIVVRDHNYLHSAALARLDKLDGICSSEDGGGQAVQALADLLPHLYNQIGPSPNEFYLKGTVTEARSLASLIDTQEKIDAMTEAQREWEVPLWPVHTRNEAIDARNVIQDLIDNDEQAKQLANAPEDGPITDEDRQVNEEARALLRQLRGNVEDGHVDESVPDTFDRVVAKVDDASTSIKPGEKPGGRPFGGLRGTMLNFGNGVARGVEAELERIAAESEEEKPKPESWRSKLFWGTAGSLVAMGIANSAGFFSWALGVLQSIQKALRGKQWQDLIDLLKSILNAAGL